MIEDLLISGCNDDTNKGYDFFMRGDLCQMSTQKQFLIAKGFDVKQNNVYPCIKKHDVKMALQLIWQNKVEGWWHYEDKYVEFKICTKE